MGVEGVVSMAVVVKVTKTYSLASGRKLAGNNVEFWGKCVENLSNDPRNAKTHLKW